MKYSIIPINYNNRKGLQRTIKSVVSQTCKDRGYIVIDGISNGGNREIIEEYAGRISYLVSEPDKDIHNTMNKSITKTTGDYLTFMNSGNSFYDNDILKNTLPYQTDSIVYGRSLYDSGREYLVYLHESPNIRHLLDNTLNHQSSFFYRELFADALYYEHYKIVSDWKSSCTAYRFLMEKVQNNWLISINQ
jgi:glycosyltransferase involved in cell wall biosynthesis